MEKKRISANSSGGCLLVHEMKSLYTQDLCHVTGYSTFALLRSQTTNLEFPLIYVLFRSSNLLDHGPSTIRLTVQVPRPVLKLRGSSRPDFTKMWLALNLKTMFAKAFCMCSAVF